MLAKNKQQISSISRTLVGHNKGMAFKSESFCQNIGNSFQLKKERHWDCGDYGEIRYLAACLLQWGLWTAAVEGCHYRRAGGRLQGRGGERIVRSLILSWRKMVDFVTTSKKFLRQSKTLRVTCWVAKILRWGAGYWENKTTAMIELCLRTLWNAF